MYRCQVILYAPNCLANIFLVVGCFYTKTLPIVQMTAVFDAPRSWVGDLARDPTSTNFLLDLNDINLNYLIDFEQSYVTYLIDFEQRLRDLFERFCENFRVL